MIPKTNLRISLKALRDSLSESRRASAAEHLQSYVEKNIQPHNVLSFVSFGSEISTRLVNKRLAESHALLLPRVEGLDLTIYRVLNPESELILSSKGILEPDPNQCEKIEFPTIQTILTPGLAFNELLHRLGYGQGHYDRLLKNTQCRSIGIGFIEQKTNLLVPDPWDVPLHTVVYF